MRNRELELAGGDSVCVGWRFTAFYNGVILLEVAVYLSMIVRFMFSVFLSISCFGILFCAGTFSDRTAIDVAVEHRFDGDWLEVVVRVTNGSEV